MSRGTHKLAYLVSHPIQYQAPLLRAIAERDEVDLTVFFLSDVSVRRHADRGFGRSFAWDVPLLGGYEHVFLRSLYATDRINFVEPVARDLRAHLEGGGFDALWVHGWFHQARLRAMRVAHELGMRVLLRGESLLHGPTWKRRLKAAVQRRVCDSADAFLAIGSRNREFYEHLGVEPERIFDVPYAVDNAFFRARSDEAALTREATRRELGLDPGRPVVLFASKLVARKRPADLLEAYRALSPDGRREPEPYLLFVGDGAERAALAARAAATGWRSIRFLGFRNQTELPRLYDLCDVLVLPSEYEPWGLVVNEAMNAARPVVATECVGAAADLIEDGRTGFTVPVGAPEVLGARLRELLGDPERAARMGAAARELVAGWSFERDVDGVLAALASVSAGRAA
jgi:glycosyltransferase involved in cell wall biosynthesis